MTRRVARLFTFSLLLGVVATVGVPWAIELIPPKPHRVHHSMADQWLYSAPPEFLLEAAREQRALGRTRRYAWGFRLDRGRDEFVQAEFRTGLPYHSMSRRATYSYRENVQTRNDGVDATQAGVAIGSPLALLTEWESRALPLTPVWPGFLADTLIFASLFAGLHQLVAFGRRWRRRKRGDCPTCAYDLTGITGPCPECGTEAPRSRVPTSIRPDHREEAAGRSAT